MSDNIVFCIIGGSIYVTTVQLRTIDLYPLLVLSLAIFDRWSEKILQPLSNEPMFLNTARINWPYKMLLIDCFKRYKRISRSSVLRFSGHVVC